MGATGGLSTSVPDALTKRWQQAASGTQRLPTGAAAAAAAVAAAAYSLDCEREDEDYSAAFAPGSIPARPTTPAASIARSNADIPLRLDC